MLNAIKNYFSENIDAICAGFAILNGEDFLPYNK